MFYSGVALTAMIAGASAFAPVMPSKRFGSTVKMEADAWNAEAQGSNYIDMAALE